MHSVHFHGTHFPKGPNLRLVSISAVWIFSVCLAMFAAFSFVGGSGFSESMGGGVALAFLVVGLIVSALFAYLEKTSQ